MSIKEKFYDLQGKTVKELLILSIPIFTLSKTTPNHYNLFLFCIPIFRINKYGPTYSINILILVWLAKLTLSFLSPFWKKIKGRRILKNAKKYYLKPEMHKRIVNKIKNGEKIVVVLFESRISCWQYEKLYSLFKNSEYFEPVIVLKPFLTQGKKVMISLMNEAYEILKNENYNVIKGYDEITDKYLDIKKEINPDIVFYSMFWKPHIHNNSYINNFEDIYSFLYAYGFDVASNPWNESMNFELQNKVTRYYLPTPIHSIIAKDNMDNLGANTFVTGSPKLDLFLDKKYVPKKVWKPQNKSKKRIIWAPHHSDGFQKDFYQFNAFFEIYDFMLELAEKYEDEIQIAFKPHPMLKPKLMDMWGSMATEEYYLKWQNKTNCQLEEGEFKDLFLESDAMILDSISFIAEYTITNKPAFFTIGSTSRVNLNLYGKENFKVLYKSENNLKEDIERFIVDVVLNGEDVKKAEREEHIQKYMLPPNNCSASQNIYDDIKRIVIDGNYIMKG